MRSRFATLAAVFLLAFSAASAASDSKLKGELDSIELTGVAVFTNVDVQGALEISPGDPIDATRISRSLDNLRALYRNHGYEHAEITARLVRRKASVAPGISSTKTETVLEISVVEGEPTRIASIRVIPDDAGGEGFDKSWKKLEPELRARVGLNPGEILDRTKLSAGNRAVQDYLATAEYIDAHVEEFNPIETTGSPGSHWVDLVIHLELGDRVSFGFRGNSAFTPLQLSGLIEDQRVLGLGKDYVSAIQARMIKEYKAEGYAQVSIQPYTYESAGRQERHVTFEISEGQRVRIAGVDFDGNSVFSSIALRRQLYERASVLTQHGYYSEQDVQKASDLLIEWIKSQGYLAAKLVTVNATPVIKTRQNDTSAEMRLMIYLYEGDQTLVESIHYDGLTAFTPDEIDHMLGLHQGNPLNLFAFSEGIESLKSAYRAKGYLSMKLLNEGTEQVVRYSQENRAADIGLVLSEGLQYRVSKIVIEGLVQTNEVVVRRELSLKEGDVLEVPKVTAFEGKLRRMGLFSSVTIRDADDPDKPGYKEIRVILQEGTPGIIAGGFGFRNDLGIRFFGQTGYTNLWQENHTLAFNLNVNRRFEDYHFAEFQAQLAYIWPYFAWGETTFRPAFTIAQTQYIQFDAITASLALTWERKLLSNPNLSATFTYSLERVNQFNAADSIDNQNLRIGSITPALRLDLRDNPLTPTSGFFAFGSYEIADPLLLSQTDPFPIGYTRAQFRADQFVPLSKDTTWYLSFRTGYERSSEAPVVDFAHGVPDPTLGGLPVIGASGSIPLIKQFALGGAGSLRGFKEQQLNIEDIAVRGTATYVNYRTQLDLPFVGAMRFGPFLDAANLNVDTFSFGNLRYGAGAGLHYQTPVGPVALDWGFNLNPQPGEDKDEIYFSIGVL